MGIIGRITNKAKNIFNNAGETAFANAGAAAYVAAAAAIKEANDDLRKERIDARRRSLLRPDFGDIVDDVRLVFGANLAELNILGQQIGTNAAAQTFGDTLYFEDAYSANDSDQLELLAHELIHTQQYRKAGSSLWEFGKRYFREYYRAGLSYDENAMEEEADEFAACFIQRAHSSVRFENTWRSTWDGGWTALVPFRIGADTFIQAYSRSTGAASISCVRPNGDGLEPVWDDQWDAGWTIFMPFTLGGTPHCLSYKASNGRVDIYSFNPGGNGYALVEEHQWTTNWTSIMPFVLNGQPHYLACKSGNGRVSIGRIDPGGVITSLWTDTWRPGWTSLMPFVRNGQPHLLAYQEQGGRVGIDRIHHEGQGVIALREDDWGSGWTTLLPLSNDGTEFLTYRGATLRRLGTTTAWVPGDGHAHVAQTRVDNRVETRWCDQWKSSWKCATSFSLNGNFYTLFSGADGSDVSISRVSL